MPRARVLVVDDDADVRRMLVDYLGAHDYDVEAAANGAEMRAAIERQVPDVVLLDVGLPGEDGLSLARFLRERHPVGIIMVTAADGIVDRVVGLEMGADDYVAKPFDPRELRAPPEERAATIARRCRTSGNGIGRTPAAHRPLHARSRYAAPARCRRQ